MTDHPRIPLAGVIGSPIAHSRSPALHGYWLRRYGIKGHYIPMDISQADLAEALKTLPKMGFVGCNVTIPHKEAILHLADVVTDRAALIGAAGAAILLTAFALRVRSPEALILFGVALSSFAGAATALIFNLSPSPIATAEVMSWLLGSVQNRSWIDVVWVTPAVLVAGALAAPAGFGSRAGGRSARAGRAHGLGVDDFA